MSFLRMRSVSGVVEVSGCGEDVMAKVYRVDENCQECKGISLRLEKPGGAYEDWQIEEFYLTKDELAVLHRLRLIVDW
jgi:hypothetical protein